MIETERWFFDQFFFCGSSTCNKMWLIRYCFKAKNEREKRKQMNKRNLRNSNIFFRSSGITDSKCIQSNVEGFNTTYTTYGAKKVCWFQFVLHVNTMHLDIHIYKTKKGRSTFFCKSFIAYWIVAHKTVTLVRSFKILSETNSILIASQFTRFVKNHLEIDTLSSASSKEDL